MFAGPVFTREAVTLPRRLRHYFYRGVYVLALLILMCTCWLVVAGTQIILTVGDMARFGSTLFQVLAPLQLALVTFLAALGSASAVSQEKDRRTLILLLLTRLSNRELVLGKLFASLLNVLAMLVAAIPVFLMITLLGGVSMDQVLRVFCVCFGTAMLAGSLGSTISLWREKTFQTLSMTALVLVLWIGIWEAVHAGFATAGNAGLAQTLAEACSPIRAILLAIHPGLETTGPLGLGGSTSYFLLFAIAGFSLLNLVAILRVRVWNPSREVRPGQQDDAAMESIWGVAHDMEQAADASQEVQAEAARAAHVDSIGRSRKQSADSREVWDNPVLWREICTWAYGRKVAVIRVAYLFFFTMAALGLYLTLNSTALAEANTGLSTVLPAMATPLLPFFLVSLVIMNALAVNAITNERDGLTLDLLLVTDLTPREFIFGKLGGILWLTKEMVLLPLACCLALWIYGFTHNQGISTESLLLLTGVLLVMDIFVTMLGIHCGITYANSRLAITVSMGSVFFLFLGVATCIMVMISFSGSFQQQLAPFLALILGGSIGLYVSLGFRNPSQAMFWASLLLPFATFHAITSFFIQHNMASFLVISSVYGFTTLAMLMPAIGEFDFAMGRSKSGQEV
ncbi:MAG: ABC transporter permease subunit [Planctomycetaceae bacterium]|nr:ABC transporter permease subunit [Planctomycetaceae bacterium]MCP4815275.1 ABC transporter permease subunit [Planctomycetaceae bacterium]